MLEKMGYPFLPITLEGLFLAKTFEVWQISEAVKKLSKWPIFRL
jgi:hypothetical protein